MGEIATHISFADVHRSLGKPLPTAPRDVVETPAWAHARVLDEVFEKSTGLYRALAPVVLTDSAIDRIPKSDLTPEVRNEFLANFQSQIDLAVKRAITPDASRHGETPLDKVTRKKKGEFIDRVRDFFHLHFYLDEPMSYQALIALTEIFSPSPGKNSSEISRKAFKMIADDPAASLILERYPEYFEHIGLNERVDEVEVDRDDTPFEGIDSFDEAEKLSL